MSNRTAFIIGCIYFTVIFLMIALAAKGAL